MSKLSIRPDLLKGHDDIIIGDPKQVNLSRKCLAMETALGYITYFICKSETSKETTWKADCSRSARWTGNI